MKTCVLVLVGTLLVLHAPPPSALALAMALLGVVALVAFLRSRHTEQWHTHRR